MQTINRSAVAIIGAICLVIAMIGVCLGGDAAGGKFNLAADAHFASADGNADWRAATNQDRPCSPETAFVSAKAGDTVYFRAGTYKVGQSEGYKGVWGPANSGTPEKPITFAAYPGEKVLFEGATEVRGGGRAKNYQLMTRALGNQYQSYIVFDGFEFVAKDRTGFCGIIISRGCDHKDNPEAWVKGCVVRNCFFDGGDFVIGSHPDDNPNSGDNNEVIRIEETDGTVVQNCRIWNIRHVKDNHNISAVKTYHNRNMRIENNEIWNCSTAIFAKSNSDDSVFKGNFIRDCNTAYDFTAFGWKIKGGGNRADGYWVSDSSRCKIQNNLILRTKRAISAAAQDTAQIDDLEVSGNTFIGGNMGFSDTPKLRIFNNIIKSKGFALDINQQRLTIGPAELDYNQWSEHSGGMVNIYVKGGGSSRKYGFANWGVNAPKDFKTWKESGVLTEIPEEPGKGDLNSDPKFLNKSGKFETLDDFRLAPDSPCRKAGRDGLDMGADIDKVGPGR